MPILLPGSVVPEEKIAAIQADLRQSVQAILSQLRAPTAPVRSPLGILTGIDLGEQILSLLDLLPDSASRDWRVATVNIAYDGLLAMIDLLKSHTEQPTVPVRR